MSQEHQGASGDASDDGMDCYLHSISTVQKAQSSNRKYFNCIVQGNDRPVRAVCYSPEKRAELKALAATKSPVKMRNFKQADTSDDIIITKWTKMTPLEKDQITFPYSDELAASTSGEPIKLSAIHNLAGEQLICVRGEASSISGIKMVTTQYSGSTQKQEVIIRDPTACVKVVLWGRYVNSLEINKTYLFKNLRVKVTKYERYLNTPRKDDFTATQCQEFDTPLVPLEEDVNTISTFSGSILGVQKASKSLACVGCHKRSVNVEGNKAVCQACDLSQIATRCPSFWSVRLLVKPDESSKNVRLILPSHMLEKFVAITGSLVELDTISEEDLVFSILDCCCKKFDFTYDNIGNEITNISLS
ncbi:Hypothetical predicted protein [Paramuricea clavata]|uniref:Uncharacterized protein n=1 Tax=Paramuricea clavata TaxID=317549 RepID=A0A6S7KBI9_PARCT|nr:Hypothetical predicted protein [Paramuricea clavata]